MSSLKRRLKARCKPKPFGIRYILRGADDMQTGWCGEVICTNIRMDSEKRKITCTMEVVK